MTPLDDVADLWAKAGGGDAILHTRLDVVLSTAVCCWGMTRDSVSGAALRAVGLNVDEAGGPWSVAFNTRTPAVACVWAAGERRFRLFPLADAATFRTGARYTPLWHPGAAIGPVRSAVENGRRLKARIAFDGYRLVVPLHTLEAHDDGRSFTAYTEYDGMPELLRHLAVVDRLSHQVLVERRRRRDGQVPIIEGPAEDGCFLSYFKISPNGVGHFDEATGDWRPLACDDVAILVEASGDG
jgi:hypothetical protein